MLRFKDKEAWGKAYAELEKIRYDGDIRDMFTKSLMTNDKAQLTGAGLKKLILDWLPVKVLEQMHTVDLTRKSDHLNGRKNCWKMGRIQEASQHQDTTRLRKVFGTTQG